MKEGGKREREKRSGKRERRGKGGGGVGGGKNTAAIMRSSVFEGKSMSD